MKTNWTKRENYIIGICGLAGSGKDTLAKILRENFLHSYEIKQFSTPIKKEVASILECDVSKIEDRDFKGSVLSFEQIYKFKQFILENNLPISTLKEVYTVREVLQAVGDGFRTLYGKEYYITKLFNSWSENIMKGNVPTKMIISDIRTLEEANYIKSIGGFLIKKNEAFDYSYNDNHITETSLKDYANYDLVIPYFDYEHEVKEFLKTIF